MGLCPTAICFDKCTVTIEVGQVVGIAGNLWLRLFAVSVHVSDPDCQIHIETDTVPYEAGSVFHLTPL